MGRRTSGNGEDTGLDRELEDLPQALRWREWMRRIEAVLFASAAPVARADLARVVGAGANVDLLIEDLRAELADRPYEVARIADTWTLRTRPAYAAAIRAAADVRDQALDLAANELMVLAAIAYHQPLTRDGLKDIFGKEVSRDLIGRLRARDLIAPGPRSPRPGAPYTFVTTDTFLAAFDLPSLSDLPDREMLQDAGLAGDAGEGRRGRIDRSRTMSSTGRYIPRDGCNGEKRLFSPPVAVDACRESDRALA